MTHGTSEEGDAPPASSVLPSELWKVVCTSAYPSGVKPWMCLSVGGGFRPRLEGKTPPYCGWIETHFDSPANTDKPLMFFSPVSPKELGQGTWTHFVVVLKALRLLQGNCLSSVGELGQGTWMLSIHNACLSCLGGAGFRPSTVFRSGALFICGQHHPLP